jgi:hypothetical protein
MKYQIRKRQNITIYLSSEVAELDEEYFRNLEENPYTGNSEKEFLDYIDSFDIYNEDSVPDYIEDFDVREELEKLGSCEKEFGSSAEKGVESNLELGLVDESYRRYGGFNVLEST